VTRPVADSPTTLSSGDGPSEARCDGTSPGQALDATSPSSADLFAAHHDRIRRYILSMVKDPATAEDLTQDVFLQVHRHLASVRDPHALVSWLYRIATHVCYDHFRRWSRQPAPASLDVAGSAEAEAAHDGESDSSLDRVIERAEMSACVRDYLDGLPDEYRNVVLLHDLEGLSNPEIAEMLDVTVGAIKIRLHRARRQLQAVLAQNCEFSRDEQGVLVCESTAATKPRSKTAT
jgi:RNA polymerase sigma-70 factor, ECF subfamily